MKLSTTTKALHCHIFSQLEVNYLLTSLAPRFTHFHNKIIPRYQAATLWSLPALSQFSYLNYGGTIVEALTRDFNEVIEKLYFFPLRI